MSEADAARRRELQHRLMADTGSSPESAVSAEGSPGIREDASPSAPKSRPWWLIPVVAAAALILGLGIGWMTVPHPAVHAAPEMSAEQQKIQREIIKAGEVDAGTLEFAGEKYGASVWTAFRGKERCVVIAAQDQRGTACGGAESQLGGYGVISAAVQVVEDDDTLVSLNATLIATLAGDWTVFAQRWETDVKDESWQQQYSDTEMRLIGALQDAGFDGQNLTILGRDGDLPIWFDYSVDKCLAIVDPGTLEITKACRTDDSETVELPYGDATYSVRWTERRGPVLTTIRGPQATTTFTCNTDGTCDPVEKDQG